MAWEISMIHWRWGLGGSEATVSCHETVDKAKGYIWRNGKRGEALLLAYLLPWTESSLNFFFSFFKGSWFT